MTSETYNFQVESREDYTARGETPQEIVPPPVATSETQEAWIEELSGSPSDGSDKSDKSDRSDRSDKSDKSDRSDGSATTGATIALPGGLDQPSAIGPEQVYATPQRVWLKLPEGVSPEDVQLYYYHPHGENQGWYPAENVEGWLVPGSYFHLRENGDTYLGFLVKHAGIVQLGSGRP